MTERVLRLAGRGLGLVGAAYAGYVAVTWWRYGRVDRAGGDPLLDRFMPDYEVAERHRVRVAAPAGVTLAAARATGLDASPVVRALFGLRALPSRLGGAPPPPPPLARRSLLEEVRAAGWAVLAEVPGRELVLGAVTQPWKATVEFRGLPPAEFASFAEPGYARIAWTMAVEPLGAADCVFRTETRVSTTDAAARARFRRYWAFLSPGIVLIRYELLRLVKAEAERRAGAVSRESASLALE
jgi:hypothetical protein